MPKTRKDVVLELVRKKGVVRPKDLVKRGIAKVYLYRLCKDGKLESKEKGLYTLPNVDFGKNQTLVEVCSKVEKGVICLNTALSYHEITTQTSPEIWIANGTKDHPPQLKNIRLRIVRFSGEALNFGIEIHTIKGAPIRVYSIAKTVADCFKYRNKVGIDVAIEALREAWQQKKCTMDELWKYAKICRVSRVMKPYMEMLE